MFMFIIVNIKIIKKIMLKKRGLGKGKNFPMKW